MLRRHSLAVLALASTALVPALLASGPAALAPPQSAAPSEGMITLYAHDDLQSGFSIHTGGAGGRIREGEVLLDDAQIVFGRFAEDMLSYGFIADELVNVVDLGPQFVAPFARGQDDAPKYPVSLFHTLFLDGAKFSYIGAGGTVERFKDAQRILDPMPRNGMYHIEPVVGHTYLLRANRTAGASRGDELVKFLVVDLRPGSSVTLRWERMR